MNASRQSERGMDTSWNEDLLRPKNDHVDFDLFLCSLDKWLPT